jgi:acyl carrier protein/NADP-dependent 3-hydroxy acid dehydrogenase YdfG
VLGDDPFGLAAARGLIRSAQSENPGRLILADLPTPAGPGDAALLAGALDSGEPEIAVRESTAYARRLASRPGHPAAPDQAAARVPGTVLVTGGTGLLGGLVARHLADTGQATRLLLTSRSGPAAAGAAVLAAQVAKSGAEVRVAACDTADRGALAALLRRFAADRPLTGVVHAAGVLDDGVIGSLTPARVDAVMRPKADAAWHLHELTRDLDLESFVLFSSASATFGGPGQGNYAAANAFLDALAAHRRAAGLPGLSLAWGMWADASGMTGHLRATDRARATTWMAELTAGQGLALLDLAVARDEPLLIPARLSTARLRAAAARGSGIPALLHGLVGAQATLPTAAGAAETVAGSLVQRLAGMPGPERDRALLELVLVHAAAVLGHASPEAVLPDRAFKELGFDSLTAVELRNRLTAATGLRLPATLVFDHPSPVALAAYLRAAISPGDGGEGTAVPVFTDLDQLEAKLSALPSDHDLRGSVTRRLQAILSKWIEADGNQAEPESAAIELRSATPDELFDFLDKELGSSS